MIAAHKARRFISAQLLVGGMLTVVLTYISLAVADHVGTPRVVRYIFAPGYVLGMRFASGTGLLDTLGSFGRIALTVNMIYYGLISFLLLRKVNWPRAPQNTRHRFWMEP